MSTIFVRVCLDKIKLKSELFNASMIGLDSVQNIEIDYDSFSDIDLFNIIKSMPEGYRTIFNLYVIEGYDHNEIGNLLEIKSSTSRSQYYRSKEWLKQAIENSQKRTKWIKAN